MRWVTMAAWAACGVVLTTGAQAAGQEVGVARITNPDWARRPSGDDVARYYPDRAARKGLGGRATIVCKVSIDGRLRDCAVVSESPPGEGFGDATLKLASKFRMKPQTRDGVPVDGGTVRIPVVYKLPPPLSITIPATAAPKMIIAGAVAASLAVLVLGLLIGAYRAFGRNRDL